MTKINFAGKSYRSIFGFARDFIPTYRKILEHETMRYEVMQGEFFELYKQLVEIQDGAPTDYFSNQPIYIDLVIVIQCLLSRRSPFESFIDIGFWVETMQPIFMEYDLIKVFSAGNEHVAVYQTVSYHHLELPDNNWWQFIVVCPTLNSIVGAGSTDGVISELIKFISELGAAKKHLDEVRDVFDNF